MILDKQLEFSKDQLATANADSTNTIDLGTKEHLKKMGHDVPNMVVQAWVTTAFTNGTSLTVALQGSDDNSTFTDIHKTAAIALSDLTKGAQLVNWRLPPEMTRRYLKLRYTVAGTFNAGKVSATLLLDAQTNKNQ